MASYQLFCMGNPLLDMQVTGGEELLKKYDLKPNDAILAEEKHMSIYEELVQKYKVTYVAGGASQNAARGAAYVLPPKSVVYAGCVGDDDLAESTTVVSSAEPDAPRVFDVHPLADAQIVDTNGAGDAFAGGFLGAYVLGKSLEECVEAGHKLGSMCVQQVGPQYQWPKVQIL